MKMCVMLLIGSVLTGSSLVVALAWKEDPEPSAALARPFAVLSVTDWLYRAPGPGGGYLLQAQTARGCASTHEWRAARLGLQPVSPEQPGVAADEFGIQQQYLDLRPPTWFIGARLPRRRRAGCAPRRV